MVVVRTAEGLVESLIGLARALDSLDLTLAGALDPDARPIRSRLSRTIRSYLMPRVSEPDIPVCVVVAGPTGSGKSTLVNSLSGIDLSRTGPIRPTTKGPVVLASEATRRHFESFAGVECEVVTGVSPVLTRIALVDTPDIDSTSVHHRDITEALIDCADVVIFVTSALRYADEVPWTVLRRAVSRGAPVIHVLNRVSPGSAGALVDLRGRLREAGLEAEVLRVPEHHLAEGAQSIPALAVKGLSNRLVGLARDRDAYQREVFSRVMHATIAQVDDLAGMLDQGRRWVDGLTAELLEQYAEAAGLLDLSGSAAAIDLPDPPPSGARRRRRWVKANRPDEVALATALTTTLQRVTSAIEDDLGSLTLRPGDLTVEVAGLGAPLTPAAMRRGIEAVVSGWFDFVKRMVRDTDPRERNLAVLVVIQRALGAGAPGTAEVVLGHSHQVLVGRARRELDGRLESLYDAAARRAVSQLDPVLDDPQAGTVLRRRAERVARSYFSDA